jgi:hypothetical protein
MGPKRVATPVAVVPRALRAYRTRRAVAALVMTGLALLTSSVAAGPSWAGPQALHRHLGDTTTTTTGTAAAVTTTVPLPLPQPPPPVAEDTCVKGTWATQDLGRPTSFQAGANGAYLWHDPDGGWALRVTHAGPRVRVVFSGSLYSASGQFIDVTTIASGGNDIVYETANKRTVYFRFVDDGWVDGLNFGTECAKAFTVNIHEGAKLASPGAIFLGAGLANPLGNPFRVDRERVVNAPDKKAAGTSRSTTTTTTTTALTTTTTTTGPPAGATAATF